MILADKAASLTTCRAAIDCGQHLKNQVLRCLSPTTIQPLLLELWLEIQLSQQASLLVAGYSYITVRIVVSFLGMVDHKGIMEVVTYMSPGGIPWFSQ